MLRVSICNPKLPLGFDDVGSWDIRAATYYWLNTDDPLPEVFMLPNTGAVGLANRSSANLLGSDVLIPPGVHGAGPFTPELRALRSSRACWFFRRSAPAPRHS
jgi:hypothetical protein